MAGPALKDHLRETRLFVGRAVVAGVLVVLLMAGLAVRLGYLQVTLFDHYRTLSSENRVKLVPLPPTRGLIYDRNGVLLADNYPTYSIEITPDQVDDLERTLEDLRHIVTITDDDVQRFHRARRQQQRFNSVPIRFKLDDEEVARFAVVRHRFPGVDIQARLLRRYPEGDKAVHALGYVGRINQQEQEQIDAAAYAGSTHIGKLGIERFPRRILVQLALQLPLGVWLMKGFFDNVSWDMQRAALIDGCGHFRAWWQVVMPAIRPGIAALAIFTFITGWGSFLIPYTFIADQQNSTLAAYVRSLQGDASPVNYSTIAAVGLFQLIPIMVFFIFTQEYLMNIFAGGSKGGT